MDPISSLAKKKSVELNQPEALWSVPISKIMGLADKRGIMAPILEKLTLAAKSPRQLNVISDYIGRSPTADNELKLLFERVDESPYSLTDWLESIETFHDWNASSGQTTELEMLLGYISCCTEATPNSQTEVGLNSTVTAMLKQYGFDG
jgi:hypothetical protein